MAKLSEFGQAFSDARKSGLKTFEFKGKKYGTKLASEVEQPSVGGKPKAGEYKTRGQYGDKDQSLKDTNYVRRDMKDRTDVIDRETQGDFSTAMNYKPRRTPEPLTTTSKPGTRTNYENEDATSETFKRGGKVASASKRADGIAQRGKTRA
jgi:hypothetical protein